MPESTPRTPDEPASAHVACVGIGGRAAIRFGQKKWLRWFLPGRGEAVFGAGPHRAGEGANRQTHETLPELRRCLGSARAGAEARPHRRGGEGRWRGCAGPWGGQVFLMEKSL